jgi:hypothetical protein
MEEVATIAICWFDKPPDGNFPDLHAYRANTDGVSYYSGMSPLQQDRKQVLQSFFTKSGPVHLEKLTESKLRL